MLQPLGPHEPPEETDCGRLVPPPPKAKADIFLRVLVSLHFGHSGDSQEEDETSSSNSSPHLSQVYSKMGMLSSRCAFTFKGLI